MPRARAPGGGEGFSRASTSVDTPRHHLENRAAEAHQHVIDDLVERLARCAATVPSAAARSRLLHALRISEGLVVASRGANCASCLKLPGVGDDDGVLLELVELVLARSEEARRVPARLLEPVAGGFAGYLQYPP